MFLSPRVHNAGTAAVQAETAQKAEMSNGYTGEDHLQLWKQLRYEVAMTRAREILSEELWLSKYERGEFGFIPETGLGQEIEEGQGPQSKAHS